MFATVASRLQIGFSSQNFTVDAKAPIKIAQRDSENVPAEADTWDTYLSTISKAIFAAKAARRIAQRDYEKVQAEADIWGRQLEIALEDDREDLACEALLRQTACRDRARNLKALMDKHSVQVSTLKSKLAFWES